MVQLFKAYYYVGYSGRLCSFDDLLNAAKVYRLGAIVDMALTALPYLLLNAFE